MCLCLSMCLCAPCLCVCVCVPMCICATPPRVCVCDASAQQQQNVTPDGRQQPSTSQRVAFSLTLSYLSRSPDSTLIFTQCQSDKLNCKHLITFNPRVTTREGSVDMTRMLHPRVTPCGLRAYLRDQSYFQRNVSPRLGRASPAHPRITDPRGCRGCALTNGEDEQSPALSSVSSLHPGPT